MQSRAQAQVVYDNGSFALTGAAGITASISADDFTLTSTQSFNAIRFWAVDPAPGLTPNFSGTLTWAVRGNENGIPGAALFSGTTSSVSVVNTGNVVNGVANNEIAQLDFAVPEVTLNAGTYWLSLKENGPSDVDDGSSVFWSFSTTRSGADLRQDPAETSPSAWGTTSTNDLAFQLRSAVVVVPEASTLALALPALTIVGMIAIRRKRSVSHH